MGTLPNEFINKAFDSIKAETESVRVCISENLKSRNIAIEACANAMNNDNLSENERNVAREDMKEYVRGGDDITKEKMNSSSVLIGTLTTVMVSVVISIIWMLGRKFPR